MGAAERLQVGAVGECDLDLDERVAASLQIEEITRLYGVFDENERVKIFSNEQFGYQRSRSSGRCGCATRARAFGCMAVSSGELA